MKSSMNLGNFYGWQKLRHAEPTQRNNYYRLDNFDFLIKVCFIRSNFIWKWIAVIRWTDFHNVGDVYSISRIANFCKSFDKKLSGSSYKRFSLDGFVVSRRFTNTNNLRFWITIPGNWLFTRISEW